MFYHARSHTHTHTHTHTPESLAYLTAVTHNVTEEADALAESLTTHLDKVQILYHISFVKSLCVATHFCVCSPEDHVICNYLYVHGGRMEYNMSRLCLSCFLY